MNPVLLKPQSQIGSQVVVQGKVWGNAKAREYLGLKPKLLAAVMGVINVFAKTRILFWWKGRVRRQKSISGLVTSPIWASRSDVPVILIGDIDQGGVIASIVGTHTILPAEDRDMIVYFLLTSFAAMYRCLTMGLPQSPISPIALALPCGLNQTAGGRFRGP